MEELGQYEGNNIPEAQVGHVRDGSQQWLQQGYVRGHGIAMKDKEMKKLCLHEWLQSTNLLVDSQMEFLSGGRSHGCESCY